MAQPPTEGDLATLIKIATPSTLDPAVLLTGFYSPDAPATGTGLCRDKSIHYSIVSNSKRLGVIQVATYWGLVK